MAANNILRGANLLNNDPDLQNPQNAGVPPGNPGAAGAQPQAGGAAAVNALADLINQVALAPPLPPPGQAVMAPRPPDRPLAMAEEQLPLNMVRNEIQREAQTLNLLANLTRLVTADHQNVQDLNDPQRNQLQILLHGMGALQQNMYHNQILLQNAQLKAKRYRNAIEMPQFLPRPDDFMRHPQEVSGKNIKNNAPVFNPAVPGADFRVTWHRLKDYGDQNLFDEREYIVALGQLLEEQAYMEYVQLRDNNTGLREILEHMEEIYVPKRSYYEDQAAVDNFRRLKGENIHKAMRRALLCVEKLRHSVPDNDWPVLLKKYMEDILFKIVSPSTQKYLRKLNEVYTESGLTYDLHTMIQKADMHEVTNDAAPKTEMPTNSTMTYPYISINPIEAMDTSNSTQQRYNKPYSSNYTGRDWYNRDKPRDNQYSPDNRNRSRDRSNSWNQQSRSRDNSRNRYNPGYNKDQGKQNQTGYSSQLRNSSQDRNSSSYSQSRDKSNDRYRNSSRDRYRDNRSDSQNRNRSRDRYRDNRSSSRDQYRPDSRDAYSRSNSRDRREQTPSNSSYKGEKAANSTNAKAKAVNIVLKDKSYYSCNQCSSLHAEKRCPLSENQ